jgi:hypothetical protein
VVGLAGVPDRHCREIQLFKVDAFLTRAATWSQRDRGLFIRELRDKLRYLRSSKQFEMDLGRAPRYACFRIGKKIDHATHRFVLRHSEILMADWIYLIHSLTTTCGGSGEIAEVEVAAAAMHGPRKEVS